MIRRRSLTALFGGRADEQTEAHHDATPRRPVAWTRAEREQLRLGETVYRHGQGDRDTGLAAVVVQAPAPVLWKQITDFDAYVDFLPYVTESRRVDVARGVSCDVVDAEFEITTKGMVTRYQVRHWWYRDASWMPFRMVANESAGAVRGGRGFWQVVPWEEDWSRNLLVYEVRLETSRLVPHFIKKLAAHRGLPTAAALIARRAEAATVIATRADAASES